MVLQLVVWPPTGGHAQLVAGAIERGQAAGEGVLDLARARFVRDDTSRLVAAPRQDALQAWTLDGRIIGPAAMW